MKNTPEIAKPSSSSTKKITLKRKIELKRFYYVRTLTDLANNYSWKIYNSFPGTFLFFDELHLNNLSIRPGYKIYGVILIFFFLTVNN